ncbi:hypothetical protein E2562_037947 [Oryza meyeriana var. granulata]|uniref:Uncharacterized protein n=1 Tax=Oryza meyeriana var. granulata TaxID=110450 RepID=A0A6G1EU74_9ORYZ|nr:hypothetical protein E2562_037947 [Oryza meyeriana var. granulata]
MSYIAAGRPPATRSALLFSVADGAPPPTCHRGPRLRPPLHQAGSPLRRSSPPLALGGTASAPSSLTPPFPPLRRSTPPAFFILCCPAGLPVFDCLSTGLLPRGSCAALPLSTMSPAWDYRRLY